MRYLGQIETFQRTIFPVRFRHIFTVRLEAMLKIHFKESEDHLRSS